MCWVDLSQDAEIYTPYTPGTNLNVDKITKNISDKEDVSIYFNVITHVLLVSLFIAPTTPCHHNTSKNTRSKNQELQHV